MRTRAVLILALLLSTLGAAEAGAQLLNPRFIVSQRMAMFRDRPGTAHDFALVRFVNDRELVVVENPLCPQTTQLELAAVPDRDAPGFVRGPLIELPCENWAAVGPGYVYTDPSGAAGGVHDISYFPNHLFVSAGGEGYTALAAPMAFAQIRFWVGDEYFMGRFYQPRVNRSSLVLFTPPSRWAALGEQAAWDTIRGIEYRSYEALHALSRATRRNPRDGRAHMMTAMVHLYEVGRNLVSWDDPTPAALYHQQKAHEALLKATPLLWDGERGDARILSFINGTSYQLARLAGDEEGVARAIDAMEDAVEINPIFNNFGIFGVASSADRDTPAYAKVMDVALDLITGGPSALCLFDQPEICANEGLASQSLSGSLVLIGDIFAKGGEEQLARLSYVIGNLFGRDDWPFQPLLDERLANLPERIGLYANDDPADDPPFLGFGEESCVNCHGQ